MRLIEKTKTVEFLDERFYELDGEYFPSVTTILNVYPKGFGFDQWLKDLGHNAAEVLRRAGEQGSRVHDAIDRYLQGEEIQWDDNVYSFLEWQMINRFVEFWTRYKPKIIANEVSLVNRSLGYGGTIDLVCEFQGTVWLIDFKTSNGIYTTHELQLAAYERLWDHEKESNQPSVDHYGILWLKAATKTDKDYQGKAWQLKTFDRIPAEAFLIFNNTFDIWKIENKDAKPKNLILPKTIKI